MARAFDPVAIAVTFEAEFGGAGNGWTDITQDVCAFPAPKWSWGLPGTGPTDLVARPGRLTFSLLNEANEQGQVGLYSPDRLESRPGFELGMAVRVKTVAEGLTRYKKYYLESIRPASGPAGTRKTACSASDWMSLAMAHKLLNLPVQVDQFAAEIFRRIVDAVTIAPAQVSETAPVVDAWASSSEDSATTTHTPDLPSGGGGLLVAVSQFADQTAITKNGSSADWTGLLTVFSGSAALTVWYREATGSDALILDSVASTKSAHRIARISGAEAVATLAPEVVGGFGNSTAPDAGALTPLGAARRRLFVALSGTDGVSTYASAPSGYENLAQRDSSSGSGVSVATAERLAIVTSENPGPFALDTAYEWAAGVIAIPGSQSGTNGYVYPFALDRRASHRYTAMQAFQELALSGMDRIFLTRDETDGETLTFQSHSVRFQNPSNIAVFDGDGFALTAARGRDRVINVVDCASPTRSRDAIGATTVLASIEDDSPVVAAGETVTIHLAYRDPANEASHIGITDMVAPVQATDYAMVSGENDVSSDFTVTATDEGTAAAIELVNGGSTNAIVTKLQIRGRGLYSYHDKHLRSSDATSIDAYGDRLLSIRLPWQVDANVCQAIADWIRDTRKDPATDAGRYEYTANRHTDLAIASQVVDVGDRIGVRETVTGITHTDGTGYWVQGISMVSDQGVLRVRYLLEKAEASQAYFTLDSSVLDGPDVLAPF